MNREKANIKEKYKTERVELIGNKIRVYPKKSFIRKLFKIQITTHPADS